MYFFSLLFRAAPVAYGSSWARGRTRAAAASLCHSHSNSRSEPCLQSAPQLMILEEEHIKSPRKKKKKKQKVQKIFRRIMQRFFYTWRARVRGSEGSSYITTKLGEHTVPCPPCTAATTPPQQVGKCSLHKGHPLSTRLQGILCFWAPWIMSYMRSLLQDWEKELFHLMHRDKHRESGKMRQG